LFDPAQLHMSDTSRNARAKDGCSGSRVMDDSKDLAAIKVPDFDLSVLDVFSSQDLNKSVKF
jgi:hypothetical protein